MTPEEYLAQLDTLTNEQVRLAFDELQELALTIEESEQVQDEEAQVAA